MKKQLLAALCASTVGLGACSLEVPDLNNPSLESLQQTPTPSGVYAASTGLLIGNRASKALQNGYVAHLGLLGRESYTFDAGDPRYVTEMLSGASLDPGSPAFGGSLWTPPYANIRNANTLLSALERVTGIPDADKKAIRGFALTQQALDFLAIVNTRDTNGGPIDVGGDYSKLAPIESKEKLLAHIVSLLDDAQGFLAEGGEKFPFPLSSGYEGFDTPKSFIAFNRAVKARVQVYQKDFAGALTSLSASFIDSTLPLKRDLGVYYSYGAGSGDTTNGLTNPNLYVHPSVIADAETKADGTTADDRVTRKVKEVAPRNYQGLTSKYVFTLYPTNTAPVPLIRNEELILLRAEANIGAGNLPAALDDINLIRVNSGGLAPLASLTDNAALNELLKQKRYSLLFEGGHRWIDMRRYGKLGELPVDQPSHKVHDKFPIPVAETDARQ